MGSCYEFLCPACGYKAEVSGGPDCGMATHTLTIVCLDCRELYDVEESDVMPIDHPKKYSVRCPKNRKHRWQEWTFPAPCPRCTQPMAKKGDLPIILWD